MKILDAIQDCGLIPRSNNNNDHGTTTTTCTECEHNKYALENCATNNTILSIRKNNQFSIYPGIRWSNLHNFTLSFNDDDDDDVSSSDDKNSTSSFSFAAFYFIKPPYTLPRDEIDPFANHPISCLNIVNSNNITITSSTSKNNDGIVTNNNNNSRGLIHGGGSDWWGIPFVGFLMTLERRPKLLQITKSTNILIANVNFQDSPLYSLYLNGVNQVEIHHCSIVNRRIDDSMHQNGKKKKSHPLLDLSAFNTDGIDVAGHNIHIHDVDIWVQDDCIAIKDNYLGDGISSNISVDNVNASGLGLVIGSIGGTTVENVTFTNSLLYETFKGIYMKFRDYDMIEPAINSSNPTTEDDTILPSPSSQQRPSSCIHNISFENITMIRPEQWSIWMGPAQQAGGNSYNPCAAKPCSLCWPYIPIGAQCNAPTDYVSILSDITLQSISIINPIHSPGVLLGSTKSPLSNIFFEDVVVVIEESPSSFQIDDLTRTFPGLQLPVNDPYLKRGAIWILILALSCLVVGIWIMCRIRGRHHRTTTRDGFVLVPSNDDNDGTLDRTNGTLSTSTDGDDDDNDYDVNGFSTEIELAAEESMNDDITPSLVDDSTMDATPTSPPKSSHAIQFFVIFLLLIFIMVMIWNIRLHFQIANVDKYFVCDGVKNGIATGRTWPVPQCLRDETG